MITNKNYKVDLSSLSDKKLLHDFAKEMNFDLKAQGKKATRDRTLIKFFKSPGLRISASGVSKTIFLSFDPVELCKRLTLLLQQKKLEKKLIQITSEEIIAIVEKSLKYKYMSKTQHKQILFKGNILHE